MTVQHNGTVQHNRLSDVTLIVGSAASAGSAIAAYFYADSLAILAGLLIGLSGLALTLVLDQRVKLGDIEHQLNVAVEEAAIAAEVARLSKIDNIFESKYAELKSEMADLARGIYQVRTLTSLYQRRHQVNRTTPIRRSATVNMPSYAGFGSRGRSSNN